MVVMYGAEGWTFNKKDKNALNVCEPKILRRIYVLLIENGGKI